MSVPAPASDSFLARVRAEQLPTRLDWHARDTIAVLAVPAIFLGGWLSGLVSTDPGPRVVADTALRIVVFAVLVVANAPMLARHWRAFRRATWRSIGLVIAGMVAIQVVISVLGAVLRAAGAGQTSGADASARAADTTTLAFGILLFASLGPLVTALIEDFAFRHTLMLTLPVWTSPLLAALVVLANAPVFGAIHIHSFGGHWLLTLPYAGAGLLMNLVYLWTRNVWHVLLMHGLNNLLLAGPVTLLLVTVLQSAVG